MRKRFETMTPETSSGGYVTNQLTTTERRSKLDKSLGDDLEALRIAHESLGEGRPLYRAGLSESVRETLAPYFLLTNRRVLAVVNVGEDAVDQVDEAAARVAAEFNDAGDTSR